MATNDEALYELVLISLCWHSLWNRGTPRTNRRTSPRGLPEQESCLWPHS